MPRLRQNKRKRVFGNLAAGTSVTHVAKLFGCFRATAHNLIRWYHQSGNTIDAPKSGRLRATTPRQDLYITRKHLRQRFQPATVTSRRLHVSDQTFRNKIWNAWLLCVIFDFDPLVIFGTPFQRHGITSVLHLHRSTENWRMINFI